MRQSIDVPGGSPKIVNMFKNKLNEPSEEKEHVWFQIVAILSSCLAALSAGLLFAWSSPSIPRIVANKDDYDITLDEASYFTVLPPIGAMCSAPIFSQLTDVIGRKKTLLIFVFVPQATAIILIATATSVYVFYAARFIVGIADACLFAALPIYVGEIATPKVRGTWGNAMTFLIYLGQLGANVIGSYLSISMAAYVCLTIPIAFLCTFSFMPESPYFYLMKNRVEDARKSLQRLRQKQDVQNELDQLKADVERQMSESGTWKDLLTISSNRRAIYAGSFLRASQQLAGIGSFAVYTQYIFAKAGGNLSASTSAIIFCVLLTVLNSCAAFTLDKLGRKKSYLYSCLFCGIVLFAESAYFYLEQYSDIDLEAFSWVPIAGMILYVLFYSFGLGIVPTLMLGELFSTSIKGKGLCLLNIIFGGLVSSVTKLFHVLDSNIGLFAPFLLFSVCCIVSTVMSFYVVPETKGRTLEEIQQSLKGGGNKKKGNGTA